MHLPVDVHRHPGTRDHHDHRQHGEQRALSERPGRDTFAVRIAGGDAALGGRIVAATSFLARFRGLMGRPALAPGDGLWLPDTSSIHMFFMRFPIDCVFLGRPGADGLRDVVGLRHRLAPWRGLAWSRGANGVLELPAGTIDTTGVRVGDRVAFTTPGQS